MTNCHSYYNTLYGCIIGDGAGCTSITIIGGQFETNLASGIFIDGTTTVTQVKIIGVDFHGNANSNGATPYGSQDLTIYGANGVVVTGCAFTSNMSGTANIVVLGSTGFIADNIIDNASSEFGVYADSATTYADINHNYVVTSTSTAGYSIYLAGSTYCDIAYNSVNSGASEASPGNFNRIFGNIYTGGSGASQFVVTGASSVCYGNTGTGASSTLTLQQSNYCATSAVGPITAAAITSLGSMSVPAGEPVAGSAYHFTAHGTLGTAASAPTYICDMRWGGTGGTLITSVQSTATANAPALGTSLSARPVLIEGYVEFQSTTTCVGWLRLQWLNSATATTAANWITAFASITSPVTVTTSSTESFTVDWTWSATGTGTTITIASSVFERVA